MRTSLWIIGIVWWLRWLSHLIFPIIMKKVRSTISISKFNFLIDFLSPSLGLECSTIKHHSEVLSECSCLFWALEQCEVLRQYVWGTGVLKRPLTCCIWRCVSAPRAVKVIVHTSCKLALTYSMYFYFTHTNTHTPQGWFICQFKA